MAVLSNSRSAGTLCSTKFSVGRVYYRNSKRFILSLYVFKG